MKKEINDEKQDCLNQLCKEYGQPLINIEDNHRRVSWKNLVLAICGICSEQKQQPRVSDDLIEEVWRLYILRTDFCGFETIEDDQEKGGWRIGNPLRTPLQKQIIGEIKNSILQNTGNNISEDSIRGILRNTHQKERWERIKSKYNH